MTFDRIIINLKVVSEVKTGQKLNTKYELFSIEDGDMSYISFLRWVRNDSRVQSTRSIMNLIETTIEVVNNTAVNNEPNAYLLDHLIMSKVGIVNLQKSYIDDITTKAYLQRCLDKIDDIASKHKM